MENPPSNSPGQTENPSTQAAWERTFLTDAGETKFYASTHLWPSGFGVDGLLLSFGPEDRGRIAQEFAPDGEERRFLERTLEEALQIPDQMHVVRRPKGLKWLPDTLLLATGRDANGTVTFDRALQMTVASVQAAAREGVRRLVLPLRGPV